jgi:maleate isomerase
MTRHFFEACGYEVVKTYGMKSVGPTAVARFTAEQIIAAFEEVDHHQAQALIHVGTNLPVSALTDFIEQKFGKPLIGVNVATYWWALRKIGILDSLPGMGILAQK